MIRNPGGRPARRYRTLGTGSVAISVMVAAELRFGAAKRGDPRLLRRVDEFVGGIDVRPFEVPADAVYGDLRARLESHGITIGALDMLIAAHAMALDCTLVTDNVREFSRIDGLAVENWLR